MDNPPSHSEADSDDDQIRYQINTDPLPTKRTGRSNCSDEEVNVETRGRVEKPFMVISDERRFRDRETLHKWDFPRRREEASESEDDAEFHDSVQGNQSDVEGDYRSEDPDRRGCELGDYRDARATERSRERRRGPCNKSVDGSKGQRQQPAGGDADPSFFMHKPKHDCKQSERD